MLWYRYGLDDWFSTWSRNLVGSEVIILTFAHITFLKLYSIPFIYTAAIRKRCHLEAIYNLVLYTFQSA